MQSSSLAPVKESTPNVTPLIDVVMCLVIFFMLVTKIGVSDSDPAIRVPAAILASPLHNRINLLTINVRSHPTENRPLVTAILDNRALQEIPLDGQHSLLATLQYLHQRSPNMTVVIRGQEDMPYQHLEPVLLACRDARIPGVQFSTRAMLVSGN